MPRLSPDALEKLLGELLPAPDFAGVSVEDMDEQDVRTTEYMDNVRTSQDTLRVIAELTGGFAVVNMNDFDKALKRIDAEASDYYILGYYSNNPDPLKRRRQVEIRVNRPNVTLTYRKECTLKPPPMAIK